MSQSKFNILKKLLYIKHVKFKMMALKITSKFNSNLFIKVNYIIKQTKTNLGSCFSVDKAHHASFHHSYCTCRTG